MQEIPKYPKNRGEQLDTDIAKATGQSLESVRLNVSKLQAAGEVMVCRSIRFDNGKQKEQLLCRISGYIPPAAPGRKPKAQAKVPV